MIPDEHMQAWLAMSVKIPSNLGLCLQRTWRRGAEAAFLGKEKRSNPWSGRPGGRNYRAFERVWNHGYDTVSAMMLESMQEKFEKVANSG